MSVFARPNTQRPNTFQPNERFDSTPPPTPPTPPSPPAPTTIADEMLRLQDAMPRTKVEFISIGGTVTDISSYYLSGANFEQIKGQAADQISAGNFDIVLSNQDDKFSEFVVTSLICNTQYHGAIIRISEGFVTGDGTVSYQVQQVGYIDQLTTDPDTSSVTFRCRDLIRSIMDQVIHSRPYVEIPVPNVSNVGNGVCSSIETKPFKTKNEDWTLTCTLGGADTVATFSVVGSVTGSIGPATSGVVFSTANGAGGIRLMLTAGSTVWVIGDKFTFSTKQYPEWTATNAGKIIWEILTGYDWDSNTAQPWAAQVLAFDHTKSTANIHLDYAAFDAAITNIDALGFLNLTGSVPYDTRVVDFLQILTLIFIGSIFTTLDGRISMNTYVPNFLGVAIRGFADSKKITKLGTTRTIDEVINYVTVAYKKTNVWQFSDEAILYDGKFMNSSSASIAKYGFLSMGYELPWFTSTGDHAQNFSTELIRKYAEPPINVDFVTGLDGMLTIIGDSVSVTDQKYGLNDVVGEVVKINKNFDTSPIEIAMRMRIDADLTAVFGFIGSEANEGDGISPQTDDWGSATATDKQFAYFSKVGDTTVDYRMF